MTGENCIAYERSIEESVNQIQEDERQSHVFVLLNHCTNNLLRYFKSFLFKNILIRIYEIPLMDIIQWLLVNGQRKSAN